MTALSFVKRTRPKDLVIDGGMPDAANFAEPAAEPYARDSLKLHVMVKPHLQLLLHVLHHSGCRKPLVFLLALNAAVHRITGGCAHKGGFRVLMFLAAVWLWSRRSRFWLSFLSAEP